jgi:hypothetical protein
LTVVVLSWSKDILDAQAKLFRQTLGIDTRIEPILLEEESDQSSFLASIRSYAIVGSGR